MRYDLSYGIRHPKNLNYRAHKIFIRYTPSVSTSVFTGPMTEPDVIQLLSAGYSEKNFRDVNGVFTDVAVLPILGKPRA